MLQEHRLELLTVTGLSRMRIYIAFNRETIKQLFVIPKLKLFNINSSGIEIIIRILEIWEMRWMVRFFIRFLVKKGHGEYDI